MILTHRKAHKWGRQCVGNLIKPNETLDDLQMDILIQKKEGFRFGVDAVLLSDLQL